MKATDLFRRYAHEIWEGSLRHPFVQGIGSGTLDEDRFKFYLFQDFIYLKEYFPIRGSGCGEKRFSRVDGTII